MGILITGAAGFIGFHVAKTLLAHGEQVYGLDNICDYYPVTLKRARIHELERSSNFYFYEGDVSDPEAVRHVLDHHPDTNRIIHLAAQAGVRYSLINPYVYITTNVLGTVTLLEAARRLKNLNSFVYASSSSVYGENTKQPFSVDDPVNRPVSLYAATKRSCELVVQSYCHLFGFSAIGLRFFTVYGPWGRPDMAAYLFADAITKGEPIKIFNYGRMARDFTYIDDIVAGTIAALDRAPSGSERHRIYNLGNHRPEPLLHFIEVLERALGRTAQKELLPLQPGDVPESFADIESSRRDLGFDPQTSIEVGLPRFVDWYKRYNGLSGT